MLCRYVVVRYVPNSGLETHRMSELVALSAWEWRAAESSACGKLGRRAQRRANWFRILFKDRMEPSS